jgi:hypothetical protein
MTLEEAFQNYKAALAAQVYTVEKWQAAEAAASNAQVAFKKAENTFAGMLGVKAYIHEDQVYTAFANRTISANPIHKE